MTADAVIVKGGLRIFRSQKFLDRKRDVSVGAEGKRASHTRCLLIMLLLRLLLTMMLQHDTVHVRFVAETWFRNVAEDSKDRLDDVPSNTDIERMFGSKTPPFQDPT
jgi:hypothetical protein